VESACPLRRDTFFPYPFVRQLLQGKYLSYNKVKGRQKHHFIVSPVILEGRGVEALLWYEYFDPERLDKSLCLGLVLRLSESTDIVGAATDCLRSSASLLNLPAQDAVMGELTQVPNLQDITIRMLHPGLLTLKTAILALVNVHARIHYVANEMGTSYRTYSKSKLFFSIPVFTSQHEITTCLAHLTKLVQTSLQIHHIFSCRLYSTLTNRVTTIM